MRRQKKFHELPAIAAWRKTCAELHQANLQLKKSEELYRSLAENSVDVIWQLDERFQFLYVSHAVRNIFGYDADELTGRSLFSILTPESVNEVRQSYARRQQLIMAGQSWESSTFALEAIRKDGHPIWVEVTVNPLFSVSGQPTGYIGVTRDISERHKNEERMYRYAFYDTLTALPNRRMFEAVLENAISDASRFTDSFTVLFLDVDGLKKVNDTYGHAVGDALLQVVADRLRHTVRVMDFVARLAGDEYVAILAGNGADGGPAVIAARLIENCHQPIVLGSHKMKVSVSIGLSLFPTDASTADELIRLADQAMYRAKKAGGNTYCCHAQ